MDYRLVSLILLASMPLNPACALELAYKKDRFEDAQNPRNTLSLMLFCEIKDVECFSC